ncbi:MAG: tRNA (adenosine(37)-N6)-dimethylallyltransferase MiaA [Bacteroidota bacterium]
MKTNCETKTLAVITGPTAVGKTKTAIELAQKLNTEIISADARQFFKEIKIATAPPTDFEKKLVKHHFAGHLSVKDYYNVSMFEKQALKVLDQIFKHSDFAVVTGGSGLYIDALCFGIDHIPDVPDSIRKQVKKIYSEGGLEALRKELKTADPESYASIDLSNPNRMMRPLEVFYASGKKLSEWQRKKLKKRSFKIKKVILNRPRNQLYKRIEQRVDDMVRYGLLEEAKHFYPLRHLNAFNTVGFKELFCWIEGKYSQEQGIEKIKVNTRRYAKRQLTWFKKYEDALWFLPSEEKQILRFIKVHKDS